MADGERLRTEVGYPHSDGRIVADAIRATCDAARESKSTLDEVLAAFENLASTVERHRLGETVAKATHVHDDTPHGPRWATGEEEDR